jgi:O-acetyl-ADP-ribose deacetylase (regulator of RNase III)
MIQYVKGDIFKSKIMTLVHGCNAQGKFNKGVAKRVREVYPDAYKEYMNAFAKGELSLGAVVWAAQHERLIANAITQHKYDKEKTGGLFVSYDGLRQCFRSINADISALATDPRICLPLIGTGYGGGSWDEISAIIEEECTDIQPIVFALDGRIPK